MPNFSLTLLEEAIGIMYSNAQSSSALMGDHIRSFDAFETDIFE
jgi:hypothetical protein